MLGVTGRQPWDNKGLGSWVFVVKGSWGHAALWSGGIGVGGLGVKALGVKRPLSQGALGSWDLGVTGLGFTDLGGHGALMLCEAL